MPSESKANRTRRAKRAACPAACVCRLRPGCRVQTGGRTTAALRRNVLHGLLCVSCRCMWQSCSNLRCSSKRVRPLRWRLRDRQGRPAAGHGGAFIIRCAAVVTHAAADGTACTDAETDAATSRPTGRQSRRRSAACSPSPGDPHSARRRPCRDPVRSLRVHAFSVANRGCIRRSTADNNGVERRQAAHVMCRRSYAPTNSSVAASAQSFTCALRWLGSCLHTNRHSTPATRPGCRRTGTTPPCGHGKRRCCGGASAVQIPPFAQHTTQTTARPLP